MARETSGIFRRLRLNIPFGEKIKNLGMAQKQMVEIAKALTFHARILILDEPTASLTQQEVDALFGIIRELKAEGVSIVYISHRLEEIFQLCDRVDGHPGRPLHRNPLGRRHLQGRTRVRHGRPQP